MTKNIIDPKEAGSKAGYKVAMELFHKTSYFIEQREFINLCIKTVISNPNRTERDGTGLSGKSHEAYELGIFIGVKKYLNKIKNLHVYRYVEKDIRKQIKDKWK